MNMVILGSETILGKAFHGAGRAAADVEAHPFDTQGMNLADVDRLVLQIPDAHVVVNCIGDQDPSAATAANRAPFTAINLHAAENVAGRAPGRRIKLVHFSSVHVFDGAKQKPTPSATPQPAEPVRDGELAPDKQVRATGRPYLVVRLPMCTGRGANLVDQMADLLRGARRAECLGARPSARPGAGRSRSRCCGSCGRTARGVIRFSAAGECLPVELARLIGNSA
ncbi:MAG: sugar nucleotide-binding protein [Kiritimatiellia bacterium]